MLSVSPHSAVFIAVNPVDFRLGIDGLVRQCRALWQHDPMSGSVFVFRNRKRTAIKLLSYDGQGFVLVYKRWSAGRLNWWPQDSTQPCQIPARELYVLLHNGHPKLANMAEDWRAVA